MKFNKILIRTHGGLGNQLFQIFFARLVAKKNNISTISYFHDTNYKRPASFELGGLDGIKKASNFETFILKLFIPKILEKLKILKCGKLHFFNIILLDSYFQDVNFYVDEDFSFIKQELIDFQREIIFKKNSLSFENNTNLVIYHLRLGDFFKTEKEQIEFVVENFHSSITNPNSVFISNRDDLYDKIFKIKFPEMKYVKTGKFSSFELLFFFASFGKIVSNGSTLAFWGSILGNKKLLINSKDDYTNNNFKLLLNLFC